MSTSSANDTRIKTIISYFEKVDAGDASYIELFANDVKFFSRNLGQRKVRIR